MNIRPAGQAFAAVISDLELWQPLTDHQIAEIRDALKSHGVLVFRRQSLSEEELADFSGRFGELEQIVRTDWAANHPAVIRISNMQDATGVPIGGLGSNELDWHTDQSYMTNPATGAVLQMVELPPNPVDTMFANLKLAWSALDAATQQEIENLSGVFQYAKRQATYKEGKLAATIANQTPDVAHPLVNIDPVTGEKSLYLDPTTMTGIVGMSDTAASTLLDRLSAHATADEFVYRHRWQSGDVVMWDNGFLLHRRDEFDASMCRLLKRTTIRMPADLHMVPTGNTLS